MTWKTPKTNWKSSDYINIEDWARIENNTEYLGNLFNLTLEALEHDRANTGFAYASYLNFLASNILKLPSGYVTPVGWQVLKSDWQALHSLSHVFITNLEKNLSLLKSTYECNQSQYNYLSETYTGERRGLI